MAGSVDNTSRLGVTLQGYDQVIALSQAHINQQLKYHFMIADPSLRDFKASVKLLKLPVSLTGKLKAPVVELVDVDNADQAIYILEFAEGTYKSYGFDENRDPPMFEEKQSAKGWKIAFWVSFSLQKMGRVPEDIRKMIDLPGSYSVEQLIIDFGTAEMLDVNLDRCEVPGITKPDEIISMKTTLKYFLETYLNTLKSKDNALSHNVLGYAVKIDIADSSARDEFLRRNTKSTPSFPPTKLRLQTINHKADANAATTTANPLNAFLFTEMTGSRDFPRADLKWSGNWFYESIGGTLCMSRSIFWDQYISPKLVFMNDDQLYALNQIVRAPAGNLYASKEEDWMLTDRPSSTSWSSTWSDVMGGAPSQVFTFDGDKNQGIYPNKWLPGPDITSTFWNKHSLRNEIYAMNGTNKIMVKQKLSFEAKWAQEKGGVLNYRTEVVTKVSWERIATIKFRSVESTGTLSIDVDVVEPSPTIDVTDSTSGRGSGLGDLFYSAKDRDKVKNAVETQVKAALGKIKTVGKDIENALNSQSKFVFPGGGTFDMKDPIFNNSGDLLIGLSYRSGEAK